MVIELPCTSVRNESQALLLFVALTRLVRLKPHPTEWRTAAGIFVTVFLINTVRLVLMSRGSVELEYWHEGGGAFIVSFAMMGATLAWTVLGARDDFAI
jgi:hypothetical protein